MASDSSEATNLKVVFVGDDGSGQTTLLHALAELPDSHPFVSNYAVRLMVKGLLVQLGLWSTRSEDEPEFRALVYPLTDLFVVCFNIAAPSSLASVQKVWAPELARCNSAGAPVILLGLQRGRRETLAKEHCVSFAQGRAVAKAMKATRYMEWDQEQLGSRASNLVYSLTSVALRWKRGTSTLALAGASSFFRRQKKNTQITTRSLGSVDGSFSGRSYRGSTAAPVIPIPDGTLMQDIGKAFGADEYADIEFIVSGHRILAHKVIVSYCREIRNVLRNFGEVSGRPSGPRVPSSLATMVAQRSGTPSGLSEPSSFESATATISSNSRWSPGRRSPGRRSSGLRSSGSKHSAAGASATSRTKRAFQTTNDSPSLHSSPTKPRRSGGGSGGDSPTKLGARHHHVVHHHHHPHHQHTPSSGSVSSALPQQQLSRTPSVNSMRSDPPPIPENDWFVAVSETPAMTRVVLADDIEPSVWSALLEFLYTGTVAALTDGKLLTRLKPVAETLGLRLLIKLCSDVLLHPFEHHANSIQRHHRRLFTDYLGSVCAHNVIHANFHDEAGLFSDMTFLVGDARFYAHKVILCQRSDVYRLMYGSPMREAGEKTHVVDMNGATFRAFLEYIYSDMSLSLTPDVAPALMQAADMHGMPRLMYTCASMLKDTISVDTVLDILEHAERYRCSELKACCLWFCQVNYAAVCQLPGYAERVGSEDRGYISKNRWTPLSLDDDILAAAGAGVDSRDSSGTLSPPIRRRSSAALSPPEEEGDHAPGACCVII